MKKLKQKSKKKPQLSFSKKLKFIKPRKGLSNVTSDSFLTFRRTQVLLGSYVIQATKSGILTKNQLESVRIYLKKSVKRVRNSKIYVLVKPNRIVTKRSNETRMGRGKGSPKSQIALISKGQLIYEISCAYFKPVLEAFNKSSTKLSIPIKLIKC